MNDIIFKTLLLKGEAGNNIIDIKKTSSDGLVDTYTITRTDGVTTTFEVTNGKSITDIKKTGSTGLVDTYTITYNDETTSTFTVTNGKDGKDGGITVDDSLSETSTNPVQNKVITNSINDVQRQICTNLLNTTAQTQTINGVTLTNNGDGTYTVNGTANGDDFIFVLKEFNDLSVFKNSKLVGCPKDIIAGCWLYLAFYADPTSSNIKEYSDFGSGIIIDYIPPNAIIARLFIVIRHDIMLNNFIFKPMLTTDLSATYDDFVPYTGDSGRLNEDVANLVKGNSPITNSDIDTILNS